MSTDTEWLSTALPAAPVPAGWTRESIRDLMYSFRIDDSPAGSLRHYVDDSLDRFLHTFALAGDLSGRVLELGANPYFTTWLLGELSGADLTLANYFGTDATEISQTVEWTLPDGSVGGRTYTSRLFNLEEIVFPYEDGSLDGVLFCEILEHLPYNPMHVLNEIHRVLVDGGVLILTTPNVARIDNVLRLARGENIYDPYSGFGVYGRHNREFTRHELVLLLRYAGFEIDLSFTADGHPVDHRSDYLFAEVAPLLEYRSSDLGQYHFIRARRAGEPRVGLPTFLYRSWPDECMVTYP